MLLEEFIKEPHKLIGSIEAVVEVVLRSSITTHSQAADILCKMDGAEAGVLTVPGGVLGAGGFVS